MYGQSTIIWVGMLTVYTTRVTVMYWQNDFSDFKVVYMNLMKTILGSKQTSFGTIRIRLFIKNEDILASLLGGGEHPRVALQQ